MHRLASLSLASSTRAVAAAAPTSTSSWMLRPLSTSVPSAASSPLPPVIATHRIVKPSTSPVPTPVDDAQLFAVIRLGASQYKVTVGDQLNVMKVKGAEVGSTMEHDDVLLVGSASKTHIGRPVVPGASVSLFVEELTVGPKTLVFKKKRRKGYKRLQGHRDQLSVLRVQAITPGESF